MNLEIGLQALPVVYIRKGYKKATLPKRILYSSYLFCCCCGLPLDDFIYLTNVVVQFEGPTLLASLIFITRSL